MATDLIILIQNIIMTTIIMTKLSQSFGDGWLIFIWISFMLAFLFKIIFYFGLHPSSELMRNDMKMTLKSWRNSRVSIPEWNICYYSNPVIETAIEMEPLKISMTQN